MLYFAKWKITLILGICLLGVVYTLPNFFPIKSLESLPDWIPHKQVNLGLDLQGGAHLLLEVQIEQVIRAQIESMVDQVRSTLRPARIGYRNLGTEGNRVVFHLREPGQGERARQLLRDQDPTIQIDQSEDGRVSLSLSETAIAERRKAAIEQSIEIVRRRIDEFGTREPTIQRQGDERILVQLPGVGDTGRVKILLNTTAQLNFHLLDTTTTPADARRGQLPPGSILLPGDPKTHDQPTEYVVRKRVVVGGEHLVDGQPSFQDGQPVVNFRFDTFGGKLFGDITQKNVGRPLAIVLDNKVISAPVIRQAILGGNGIISGRFTVQETQDLSLLLRAGALPAPITVLEERTVGPGLGADSIRAGEIACMIGLVLVVVFMIVAYGLFGLMANVALFFNMALILGSLSLLQATLTLPGIAGIVLTIGMAVDANVLIFERIREEVRNGRTPISSVEAGYKRALTTIIDAQLTTLIAAVLLFGFGTGPIRGFSVTLAIGLATSMFTAIWLTRLMVVLWLRRRRPATLPI